MNMNELLMKVYNADFNLLEDLEVKNYIPVMEKKKFIIDIISACTDENDGFVSVDRFKMNIYFNMKVLGLYTNLEIATNFDDMIEQYDALCERGLLDGILSVFHNDYTSMCKVLDGMLDELLVQNSIEAQVVRIANKLSAMIDMVGNNLNQLDVSSILPDGENIIELMKQIKTLK